MPSSHPDIENIYPHKLWLDTRHSNLYSKKIDQDPAKKSKCISIGQSISANNSNFLCLEGKWVKPDFGKDIIRQPIFFEELDAKNCSNFEMYVYDQMV